MIKYKWYYNGKTFLIFYLPAIDSGKIFQKLNIDLWIVITFVFKEDVNIDRRSRMKGDFVKKIGSGFFLIRADERFFGEFQFF